MPQSNKWRCNLVCWRMHGHEFGQAYAPNVTDYINRWTVNSNHVLVKRDSESPEWETDKTATLRITSNIYFHSITKTKNNTVRYLWRSLYCYFQHWDSYDKRYIFRTEMKREREKERKKSLSALRCVSMHLCHHSPTLAINWRTDYIVFNDNGRWCRLCRCLCRICTRLLCERSVALMPDINKENESKTMEMCEREW